MNDYKDSNIVNILWTGGLDSTFRICELSRLDVIIQPYYIVEERPSELYEREAIGWITHYLRNQTSTKAIIMDTIFVNRDSFNENREISNAWKNLREKYRIGSQYEYIAKFASQNNLILELGIELSTRNKAHNALIGEGNLINISPIPGVEQYCIDTNNCSDSIYTIFSRLRFPKLLFESSKLEEVEILSKWGLEEVVGHTWFCHTPVSGLPCGRCNPCRDALKEGFSWRVPIRGRIFGFIRDCRDVAERNLKKVFKVTG